MQDKKATVEDHGTDLTITIPTDVNFKLPLFSVIWFILWFLIFKYTLALEQTVLYIWLVGWSFAGVFMVILNLWQKFGFEQIKVSKSEITLSIKLFDLGFSRTMQPPKDILCTIVDERTNKQQAKPGRINLNNPGKIRFKQLHRSYDFGAALGDSKAKYLVELINEKISKVARN